LNPPDDDVFGKARSFSDHARRLSERNLWAYRTRCLRRDGARVLAAATEGAPRWVIDCSTNDYLGMNANPEVIDAVKRAVEEHGVGARAASMLSGNTPIHLELEESLAWFLRKEAVLLTNSGYACQMAVAQGLLRSTDAVFYDRFCHGSLVDGMRLSGATMYRYGNRDLDSLAHLLEEKRDAHRGAMIVSDGVFSAEGTLAPVAGLVQAARRYRARLFMDDAHAIGTINEGRGSSVFEGVDLVSGTLSKSLGSAGGFAAGPSAVIDYVRCFGNAACNSVNVSVANAATALAALRIIAREPGLGDRLRLKALDLRRWLRDEGIETNEGGVPIISLLCGKDIDAFRAWRALFDAGLLVHALPFPIVPRGRACIRLRVTLTHDQQDLEEIVKILGSQRQHFKQSRDTT
jgi:8-amino-7-oxononanoate synthase